MDHYQRVLRFLTRVGPREVVSGVDFLNDVVVNLAPFALCITSAKQKRQNHDTVTKKRNHINSPKAVGEPADNVFVNVDQQKAELNRSAI